MNRKRLYALWAVLFSLCAGLGFIPAAGGLLQGMMTLLSLVSFLPPAALLYDARKTGHRDTAALIRNLSAASLGVTLGLLVLNFLLAMGSEFWGSVVYYLLVILSSPMVCSGYWAVSLFLWACLLVGSGQALKRIDNG